jgi:hypothetical protein
VKFLGRDTCEIYLPNDVDGLTVYDPEHPKSKKILCREKTPYVSQKKNSIMAEEEPAEVYNIKPPSFGQNIVPFDAEDHQQPTLIEDRATQIQSEGGNHNRKEEENENKPFWVFYENKQKQRSQTPKKKAVDVVNGLSQDENRKAGSEKHHKFSFFDPQNVKGTFADENSINLQHSERKPFEVSNSQKGMSNQPFLKEAQASTSQLYNTSTNSFSKGTNQIISIASRHSGSNLKPAIKTTSKFGASSSRGGEESIAPSSSLRTDAILDHLIQVIPTSESHGKNFRQMEMDEKFKERFGTKLAVTPLKIFKADDRPDAKAGSQQR